MWRSHRDRDDRFEIERRTRRTGIITTRCDSGDKAKDTGRREPKKTATTKKKDEARRRPRRHPPGAPVVGGVGRRPPRHVRPTATSARHRHGCCFPAPVRGAGGEETRRLQPHPRLDRPGPRVGRPVGARTDHLRPLPGHDERRPVRRVGGLRVRHDRRGDRPGVRPGRRHGLRRRSIAGAGQGAESGVRHDPRRVRSRGRTHGPDHDRTGVPGVGGGDTGGSGGPPGRAQG